MTLDHLALAIARPGRVAGTRTRPARSARLLLAARLSLLTGLALPHLDAQSQAMIQDARRFQTPAVFVLPKAPTSALEAFAERSFRIEVLIDENGLVRSLAQVDPPDAEFRAHLEDASRFWVFFPEVDPATCNTVPSTGLVEMTYSRGEAEPRVWLSMQTGQRLLEAPMPSVLRRPPVRPYPSDELRKGITGDVYVIGVLDPQGRVTETRLLLGVPPSPGFVQHARAHLRAMRFDAGLAEIRCVVFHYSYRIAE